MNVFMIDFMLLLVFNMQICNTIDSNTRSQKKMTTHNSAENEETCPAQALLKIL